MQVGTSIELTGTDPDELVEEAKNSAEKMEEELKSKTSDYASRVVDV